jgi:hypothetical protein
VRWLFIVIVLLHGVIHLMGFAKAFGYAELPQLTAPISQSMGLVWLAAAILCITTVIALFAWPRGWWGIAMAAAVVSQIAITSAWADARFGTLANLLLLAGAVYGFLTQGPTSFRAAFEHDAGLGLTHNKTSGQPESITESDVAGLPPPVQRYLHAVGVMGQPRVQLPD